MCGDETNKTKKAMRDEGARLACSLALSVERLRKPVVRCVQRREEARSVPPGGTVTVFYVTSTPGQQLFSDEIHATPQGEEIDGRKKRSNVDKSNVERLGSESGQESSIFPRRPRARKSNVERLGSESGHESSIFPRRPRARPSSRLSAKPLLMSRR